MIIVTEEYPGSDMNLNSECRDSLNETEDPADSVSLGSFLDAQESGFDYFTEERPVFGLRRIKSKFRRNHRGAS